MAAEILTLYRANWRVLVPTAAVAFFILDIVAGALWLVVANGPESAVISVVTTVVASVYYSGMVALVVAADQRGELRPSALTMAMKVPVVRLLVADLLTTVIICAGLALLVIPGVIAFTLTALVGPVIVLEGTGIGATFRRSYELVVPWFWAVLAIALALALVMLAATAVIAVGAGALTDGALWAYMVGALVGNGIIAPLLALTIAVLYLELRSAESEA
jgi:hypothetical protein